VFRDAVGADLEDVSKTEQTSQGTTKLTEAAR
jgi:hypothetical protein